MSKKPSSTAGKPAAIKAASRRSLMDFWQTKTLEELAAEQGVHPIEHLEDVLGQGAELWHGDAEFEAFLAELRESRQRGRL